MEKILNIFKHSENIKILDLIFYSLEDDILLQLPETTKINELKDLYIKEKYSAKDKVKSFVFVYKGLKIDFKSKDVISKKFKNNDTIFVLCKGENITIEKLLEKRKNKINKKSENKVKDDNGDKNKDKKENVKSLNNPNNTNVPNINNQNNIDDPNLNSQNKIKDLNINNQNNINDSNLKNQNNINNPNINNQNNINQPNIKSQNNISDSNSINQNNINVHKESNQNNKMDPNLIEGNINKIHKDKKYIDINNDILRFMVNRSFIEKENIDKNKYKNTKSINDCLKDKNIHYFILGILGKYLEKIGVKVIIEYHPHSKPTENDLFFNRKLLQFIYTGYIFKKNYILDFTLDENIISKIEKDQKEKEKFNKKIEDIIIKLYKLDKDEFLITNYKKDKKHFTVIIVLKSNKELTKKDLLNNFKNDPELKSCKDIKINLFFPSIKLGESILDYKGDNFEDKFWRRNQKTGGEDYFPPIGWKKFGLKVFDCYDNKDNSWLGTRNDSGEWCIAYCGFTEIKQKMVQKYEDDFDIKNPGKKVGIGVYCTPNPNFMEQNTEIISSLGKNYKIGFMIRIKPDRIRSPKSNKDIWVVDGTDDDFRPYGILLKKI